MTSDWLGFFDAVYSLHGTEQLWLDGLLGAAMPIVGDGFGAWAACYHAEAGGMAVRIHAMRDSPRAPSNLLAASLAELAPAFVAAELPMLHAFTGCELDAKYGYAFLRNGRFESFGIRDGLVLNALNPDGRGVFLCAGQSRRVRLPANRRATLARAAVHLGAAARLRGRYAAINGTRALDVHGVEAVLEVDGRLAHAVGVAREARCRAELGELARSLDRSRARGGRADELAMRRGLVQARWTVLEEVDVDGRRFVLARDNRPAPSGPTALSSRERQVLALAGQGHSQKLIAYELGLSHSTVRVLLSRAYQKLGVRGLGEALSRVSASAART